MLIGCTLRGGNCPYLQADLCGFVVQCTLVHQPHNVHFATKAAVKLILNPDDVRVDTQRTHAHTHARAHDNVQGQRVNAIL